jgi:hypothetical protein
MVHNAGRNPYVRGPHLSIAANFARSSGVIAEAGPGSGLARSASQPPQALASPASGDPDVGAVEAEDVALSVRSSADVRRKTVESWW